MTVITNYQLKNIALQNIAVYHHRRKYLLEKHKNGPSHGGVARIKIGTVGTSSTGSRLVLHCSGRFAR